MGWDLRRRRVSVFREVGVVGTYNASWRQSVHSRLAGYENTDDAERLAEGSAMRVVRWMSRSLTDRRRARAPFAGSRSGYLHKTAT